MRMSSKPAVYCIDGLNFVRSFMSPGFSEDENARTAEFLEWLESVAASEAFSRCEFRVIFDGIYRNAGHTLRGSISISFSDGNNADDLLLEQCVYLKNSGKRSILVTSDRGLMESAQAEGVKTMYCEGFYDYCSRFAAGR